MYTIQRSRHLIFAVTAMIAVFLCTVHVTVSCADLGPGQWVHMQRQAPANNIRSLFNGPDGSLWCGVGSVFHCLKDDTWVRYAYDSSVLTNHTPFMIDDDGRLYFIDNYTLVMWDDGVIERYPGVKIGLPVTGAFSSDGNLVISSKNIRYGGVYVFDGSEVVRIDDRKTFSVAVDKDDFIWATVIDPETELMRLVRHEDGVWVDYSDEVEQLYPAPQHKMTVQKAPDGALWVCNLGKIGILEDGQWTFTDGGGYPVFLWFGPDDQVWGYGSEDLYRLDEEKRWRVIFKMSVGPADIPLFVGATPDGTIWTLDDNVVYRLEGDFFKEYVARFDMASNDVTCLEYTVEGELLAGHGRRELPVFDQPRVGLSVKRDGKWEFGSKFDDVEFTNVFQFKKTPDDEVMAYTDGGFKLIYNSVWTKEDSLFLGNQTDMEWWNYSMWITTTRGLVEYIGEPEYEFYFPLDEDKPYPLDNLHIDDNGLFYMQTDVGHMITFDGNSWRKEIIDDGFTNDIAVNADGVVWGARQWELTRWDFEYTKWIKYRDLDVGRMVKYDPKGRLWFSSNGVTGYVDENDIIHEIPELAEYAVDEIAFADDGRIAVNLFDFDREEFYGILEFRPGSSVDVETERPTSLLLTGSHPNPFNPSTTISFTLPESKRAIVEIFNIAGQHVATLADRAFPQGANSIVWHASSHPSGVYVYRVKAGNAVGTGRMVLLK